MEPLDLVRLPPLMKLSRGSPDIVVGLLDGPVALDHPDLASNHIRTLYEGPAAWRDIRDAACRHGTFIAGVLAAQRGTPAPSIAPECTLLVRPVFRDATVVGELPTATPVELGDALVQCVDGGARILNLSAALTGGTFTADRHLDEALQYVAERGALLIAAAGNQGVVAGSAITRHPWVIPVIGYTRSGLPLGQSNLSRSIGISGLGGPGDGVISLAPGGGTTVSSGTSIAVPFVAGAAALLWSLFPSLLAIDIKAALLFSRAGRRKSITPPLLDAWGSYLRLSAGRVGSAL